MSKSIWNQYGSDIDRIARMDNVYAIADIHEIYNRDGVDLSPYVQAQRLNIIRGYDAAIAAAM